MLIIIYLCDNIKEFQQCTSVFLKVGLRAPRGALKGCWGGGHAARGVGGRYGVLKSETKIPHDKTTIPYS